MLGLENNGNNEQFQRIPNPNTKSMVIKTFSFLISLWVAYQYREKRENSMDLYIPKVCIFCKIQWCTQKYVDISPENVDIAMNTALEECGYSKDKQISWATKFGGQTHKRTKSITIPGNRSVNYGKAIGHRFASE